MNEPFISFFHSCAVSLWRDLSPDGWQLVSLSCQPDELAVSLVFPKTGARVVLQGDALLQQVKEYHGRKLTHIHYFQSS